MIFGHTHIIYHMVGDRSQDIVPRLRVPWESRVTPWKKNNIGFCPLFAETEGCPMVKLGYKRSVMCL